MHLISHIQIPTLAQFFLLEVKELALKHLNHNQTQN